MQQTQARSNIYALLSRILMQELDSKTLDQIKSDETILDFFPNLKKWDGLKTLENSEILEQHLNPDFANISLLHLIPYETFYTRNDQMIEAGGANPVTDIYSVYDFVVDYEAARVVSSDHIGVELEFMHHLCNAEVIAQNDEDNDGVEELRRVQREFLNSHVINWAPMYLLSVKYESRSALYSDAADMALEFILSDNEYLSGNAASI